MQKTIDSFISHAKFFCFAFLAAIFIQTFVFKIFVVNGKSMEPAYQGDEIVVVDRLSYYFSEPQRGDVITLEPPVSSGQNKAYLKRIIGLPGETIRIHNGKVFIKTKKSDIFVELNESYLSLDNFENTGLPVNVLKTDFLIPEDYYWVIGDNRSNSSDSRNCFYMCVAGSETHFLPRENIIGRTFIEIGNTSFNRMPRFFDIPSRFEYSEISR